jgi:negative regulator of replication initiation
LDDDVIEQVKQYAESRLMALGRAASDLIRRGLTTPVQTKTVNGIRVVLLPHGSPPVDFSEVKSLLEDEV